MAKRSSGRLAPTLCDMTRGECLAQIYARSPAVLLAFSGGKDSLAAWIILRRYGFRVVPFYRILVPGLVFVERSLHYYEQFFNTHIYRVLHPNFYHWIRTHAFQPPIRHRAIFDLDLPIFGYADVNAGVRRTAGLPDDAFCAVGTRVADSIMRRMVLKKYGPINEGSLSFSPIFDMLKDELIDVLAHERVRLAEDYCIFGRSFDGIDYRYLAGVRAHYPDDYQRILDWFSWAKYEFARMAMVRRYADEQRK